MAWIPTLGIGVSGEVFRKKSFCRYSGVVQKWGFLGNKAG
jgi:hypothetical protein